MTLRAVPLAEVMDETLVGLCTVPGCTSDVYTRGMCRVHDLRRRAGLPLDLPKAVGCRARVLLARAALVDAAWKLFDVDTNEGSDEEFERAADELCRMAVRVAPALEKRFAPEEGRRGA